MDTVLFHKFTQHRDLKRELLGTGDAELIEVTFIILTAGRRADEVPSRTRTKIRSGGAGRMGRVRMSLGKHLDDCVKFYVNNKGDEIFKGVPWFLGAPGPIGLDDIYDHPCVCILSTSMRCSFFGSGGDRLGLLWVSRTQTEPPSADPTHHPPPPWAKLERTHTSIKISMEGAPRQHRLGSLGTWSSSVRRFVAMT